MDEASTPAALWLFAVVGGPVILGLLMAWWVWRSRRRQAIHGDAGPGRWTIQVGVLIVALVAVAVIVGWWVGFYQVAAAP